MGKNKKIKGTRAKGSLILNNKSENKRTAVKISTSQKDILKSLFELPVQNSWLSEDEIDKILRDSTVAAAIGSRKASTLKKEILISSENKDIKDEMEKVFSFDVIDSMLDIPYYGFGVFELNWYANKSFLFPNIEERFYKNFILENKVLKFNAIGIAEDIPPFKAVYSTYKAKPNKPYGQPLFHTLFWLIEFKNASLQFWVELLERFGTPWVIAKTEGDKDILADEIYNMLGGDGAVIDSEDAIDIKTATDKGNFKELIEYIDDQIREIILGGNLTGNVKGGSQAAATVHNDIREDLAQADENIVNKLIKDIIQNFKELNNLSLEITGKLKDKDDPNKELADRDKIIYDMGYQPTKEYIEETYSIKVTEIKKDITKPITNNTDISSASALSLRKANLLAMNNPIAVDELDRNIQNLDLEKITLTFQKQILQIINKSDSFEEMLDTLFKAYPTFDTKLLEESLYKNLTLSQILAAAQIEDENPNG
jgi:phage gp29-like protein